jgi:nitroreductase
MDVKQAIIKRRAYRSLDPITITNDLITDLVESAQLSASCFNNQPWRYVFVYDQKVLKEMHTALSSGNEWATRASMIIAVFCKKEDDCIIRDREYYLFDTGMATAFIILRATELGLVAHPIAGFSPKKVREILHIPDEMKVISLVIIGKHATKIYQILTEKQKKDEPYRPQRLPNEKIAYMNAYRKPHA